MSDTHTHDGIDRRFVIHPRGKDWQPALPPLPHPKETRNRG